MPLLPGDPSPSFTAECTSNPRYRFDTVAGRYIVLTFMGSAASPAGSRLLADALRLQLHFDDQKISFFGVSTDPADRARLEPRLPGIRYFWDADETVSRLYDAAGADGYRPRTVIIDPMLRVIAVIGARPDHGNMLAQLVERLPPVDGHAGTVLHAPVLIAPRVFEPAFCRQLIGEYERLGGEDSGFMRQVDGKTIGLIDHGHKRRADCNIEDAALREGAAARISRRLFPLIRQAFAFEPTRMERYIVACYDGGDGGFFRPHRDNTTSGTAHRRFAVTINLNAGEYEGGDLRFPEFGSRTYRAPTGGAVVFSCSLLHEAKPVTRGRRYAFLPFLYDDAGALLRERNNEHLADNVSRYSGAAHPEAAESDGPGG
jgi:predicted 2-oxoglutarate/Fe(II)-dependent dioxygenase YbiX/peroxiredoxin